jgi:large subunit ribosomal protein L25
MEIKLKGQIRERGEKLANTTIGAIIYGSGLENILLKMNSIEFTKVFEKAGESNLINLDVEGKGNFKVLIKEVQRDPIKDFIIHVDFYKVDMDKEINTEIPLSFIGESPAIKTLGALLMKGIDEIEVECLPSDLVDHIDIDISVLNEIGDSIKIKDIKLPKGLKLLENEDDIVVSIMEQPKEEEVAAPTPETTAGTSNENKSDSGAKEADKKE